MQHGLAAVLAVAQLACVDAANGGGSADPAVALEPLELALAASGEVYLVIDPPRRAIEIKVRGLVLDARQIDGLAIEARRRLLAGEPAALRLPAVFRVTDDPQAGLRWRIAPERLVPYAADGADGSPAAVALPMRPPPERYAVRLSEDLELHVVRHLTLGAPRRLRAVFAHSVASLRGRALAGRRLVIAADGATAQWLHHRLRPGTALLLGVPWPERSET